jgi:diacylglycerol kinase (ATP)
MLKTFQHIVHAAGYSMSGLIYLLRNEVAARLELLAIIVALLWFFVLGRPVFDYLILLVLGCILLSIEALNTAIEEVVDKISPDRSDFAKAAKNLGSTAVFFMLTAGGLYVAAVTADSFGLIVL